MPRLENWRIWHNNTRAEATVGGFFLTAATYGPDKPGWWAVHGAGGGAAGDSNGLPTTLADMQDAAEAEVARLLAEDAGVRALLGNSSFTAVVFRLGSTDPLAALERLFARAEAAEARVAELDYRRQMVAELALVVERERDALRAALRWIPTGDELPPDGVEVEAIFHVFGRNEVDFVAYIGHGRWRQTRTGFILTDTRPTHWRHLPKVEQ